MLILNVKKRGIRVINTGVYLTQCVVYMVVAATFAMFIHSSPGKIFYSGCELNDLFVPNMEHIIDSVN